MGKCIRTILLKLYKPSKIKKTIIDEAMLNYTKAYQYLLDKAEEDINNILHECQSIREQYRSTYIKKWINENSDRDLNRFSIQPFKDSIKIDFAATFCRYLNLKLKDNDVNYPSVYVSNSMMEKKYDEIVKSYANGNTLPSLIENKINNLISKTEKYRPIFFCRYSSKRNYSILYDADNDRYYAKIYLMNVKNDKRLEPKTYINKYLIYINKEHEEFNERISRRCYLIFPLCFGKWQEKYLKEALENPEILKTSRLIKKKNEYYLAVSIVKEVPDLPKPVNFMGVSRGIQNAINYCIVDREGNIMKEDTKDLDTNNIADNKLYEVANSIVDLALKNKCQIIMEKLIDKGDGLIWDGDDKSKPLISYLKYNQLVSIIDYKMAGKGIPGVVKVSPINIFYTCPDCGNYSKGNRFSKEMLICTSCGLAMDIAKVGSLNLARRLIKYSKDTIKIKVEETSKGIRFINSEIGLDYYPLNPYDCKDEFMKEIDKIIKQFYSNIEQEATKPKFKKKLSLIKKLQDNKNIFEVIN